MEPVSPEELAAALNSMSKPAPGKDNVKVAELKKIPPERLRQACDLAILCGQFPARLGRFKTALIPKCAEPRGPREYHPIAISSVYVRLIHRVLAVWLETTIGTSIRQKAFKSVDGCMENISILKSVIEATKKIKGSERIGDLHLAFIDIRKAFDSVPSFYCRGTERSGGASPSDPVCECCLRGRE